MALPEAFRSRLTWEQYLQTPESMERVEIEDGEVKTMTSPTGKHQNVLGNLYLLLAGNPALRSRGALLMAPFGVVISRHPLRVRQPDLLFVSNQRVPMDELANLRRLETAPDLVVEILSPSDTSPAWRENWETLIWWACKRCGFWTWSRVRCSSCLVKSEAGTGNDLSQARKRYPLRCYPR